MHSKIIDISLSTFKENKALTFIMTCIIIGSLLTALIPPLILEKIVDTLTNKQDVVVSIMIFYFIILAISGLLESLQNGMITIIGQAITHKVRSVLSLKLEKLPSSYFDHHAYGEITSIFVNDVDMIDSLFTNGILSMIVDSFKVISIILIVFTKSLGLGLLLVCITPILLWMTYIFQKRMKKAQVDNRIAISKMNKHIPESIHSIRMIHTYHQEKYMENKYKDYIEDGCKAMDVSNFYDSIYSPIIIFVSTVLISIVMVCSSLGSEMQAFFGMSTGSAVAIIAYISKVFDPLESLGMEIQNIQGALAGIQRMDTFLNEEEMIKEKNTHSNDSFIKIDHLSFGYAEDKKIFNDFSLDIQKGEHILFIGRTGAGKSTLFKLILGLYKPVSGYITIHEKDTFNLTEKERQSLFGYVTQNFSSVHGTLKDEITLFDDSISDDKVFEVLKLCGFDQFDDLSISFSSLTFSQGELQLLSIARALIRNPEILFLDEMSANLDSVTEKRILDLIDQISKDKTVLSISHRLSENKENVRMIEIY